MEPNDFPAFLLIGRRICAPYTTIMYVASHGHLVLFFIQGRKKRAPSYISVIFKALASAKMDSL
jgi:hypothetical protein